MVVILDELQLYRRSSSWISAPAKWHTVGCLVGIA